MQSQPGGTEKEHQQFASEHSKRTAFSYKPCVCVYGAIIEVRSGVGEKQQTMDTRLNTMTVVNELFCSTAEFYLLIICNFTWLCVGAPCTKRMYEMFIIIIHWIGRVSWMLLPLRFAFVHAYIPVELVCWVLSLVLRFQVTRDSVRWSLSRAIADVEPVAERNWIQLVLYSSSECSCWRQQLIFT